MPIDWKAAARHYRTLYSEAVEREGAGHRREMQTEINRLRIENEGLRELVLRLAGVIERGSDHNEHRYLRYVPIGYAAKHALDEVPAFVPVEIQP